MEDAGEDVEIFEEGSEILKDIIRLDCIVNYLEYIEEYVEDMEDILEGDVIEDIEDMEDAGEYVEIL